MAVASLNKFTVPLSTNQSSSTQGLLMPKLKYRFRATFINFGVTAVIEGVRDLVAKKKGTIVIISSNSAPMPIGKARLISTSLKS